MLANRKKNQLLYVINNKHKNYETAPPTKSINSIN